MTILPWQIQIEHLFTEAFGMCIMCFMVQVVADKRVTYIEHNREAYIALPLYFLISRTFAAKDSLVNPALGLAYQLVYCYATGQWYVFYQFYIYIVSTYLGALIAVGLFELGYRPMYPMKKPEAI